MNKRIRQMMGRAVVGTTLAAIAVIGAGQMASASGTTGTCVTIGTFTEDGTCTVLPGETVNFNLKSGNGGAGGAGGAGGNGVSSTFAGGAGGAGGIGGGSGAGPRIIGSYINATDTTVTLSIFVGVNGTDGSAGANGVDGFGLTPDGGNGQDGSDGTEGTSSALVEGTEIVEDIERMIAAASGGGGGEGGKGGQGGTGGTLLGLGTAGENGENGLRSYDGSYYPVPLPDSWIVTEDDLGAPSIVFSGTGVPATTTTTVPVTTTAPPQLPATGSDTSPTVWVTLLVLASGASLVVLARRRVVS
jgi:LPXTG-motif cell wall-anchored protein